MDYRIALLHRLGFPVTKENLRFLSTWQAHEGGHTKNAAKFNWWNSTRGDQYPLMPGSNRVRSYPDFATGVRYTAETLNNGRYPDIMAGLKAGNPYTAPGLEDDLSVWVSGTPNKGLRYAKNILGAAYKEPRHSKKLASATAQGNVGRQMPGPDPKVGNLDAARQALMGYFMASNAALVAGQPQPNFLPFAQAIRDASAPSANQETPNPAFPRPAASQTGKRTMVNRPGAGWGGSLNIASGFKDIGEQFGLKVISAKRDTKHTASGGVSDHWVGSKNAYAFDLSNGSAPTTEMDSAAREIMGALGVPYDGKSELVKNVNVNGYRVQVIYRSNVGGNHYNHIHVGVRKL